MIRARLLLFILISLQVSFGVVKGDEYKEDALVNNYATVFVPAVAIMAEKTLEFVGSSLSIGFLAYLFGKEVKDYKKPKPKNNVRKFNSGGDKEPESGNEKGNKKASIKISEKDKRHIFRDRKGHLPDTPENRKLLIDVGSDQKNFLGFDGHGNKWFAKTLSNGKQVWASVRDNLIRYGGLNNMPRKFNNLTGLCSPKG